MTPHERTFSTLKWVKNDLRSRLDQQHLNACIRLYASKLMFDGLRCFPFSRALELWLAEKKRRSIAILIE